MSLSLSTRLPHASFKPGMVALQFDYVQSDTFWQRFVNVLSTSRLCSFGHVLVMFHLRFLMFSPIGSGYIPSLFHLWLRLRHRFHLYYV